MGKQSDIKNHKSRLYAVQCYGEDGEASIAVDFSAYGNTLGLYSIASVYPTMFPKAEKSTFGTVAALLDEKSTFATVAAL